MQKSKWLCRAGLLYFAAAAHLLHAQPATEGSLMADRAAKLPPPGSRQPTIADTMRVMDDFGQCLVRSKARLAALAIKVVPDDAEVSRAAQQAEARVCLTSQTPGYEARLRFDKELLRGSVFKALYRQKYAVQQPAFRAQRIDWTETTAALNADAAERFRIFHQIAECTLAAAPASAHMLIVATYGSEPHRQAFQQLAPAMGNCLPEGMELKLPRPSIAGALAEVAYRAAEANHR
jgi:hypothetical protein